MCITYPYYQPERDIPSLRGKVILITGGTAGLGKEVAAQLSQHGRPAKVWIAGRSAERAGTTIAEIRRRLRKRPSLTSCSQRPSSSREAFTRSPDGGNAAFSVETMGSVTTHGDDRGEPAEEPSNNQLSNSLEMGSLRPNASHIDLASRRIRSDRIGRSLPASIAASMRSNIDASGRTPDETEVYFLYMDLANLESVKDAASRFLACVDRLDILILNAAEAAAFSGVTEQGYERHFGTNHLGHALLIKLLMRLLVRTATCDSVGSDVRVISVSSSAHRFTPPEGIDFDSLKLDLGREPAIPGGFRLINRAQHSSETSINGSNGHGISPGNTNSGITAMQPGVRGGHQASLSLQGPAGPSHRFLYGQSKLANILYARELAERCPLFTTVSIHPGISKSMAGRRRGGSRVAGSGAMLERCEKMIVLVFGAPIEEGAKNHIWAATGSGLCNGQYYDPVGMQARPYGVGDDRVLSWKLWDWTQRELAGYNL